MYIRCCRIAIALDSAWEAAGSVRMLGMSAIWTDMCQSESSRRAPNYRCDSSNIFKAKTESVSDFHFNRSSRFSMHPAFSIILTVFCHRLGRRGNFRFYKPIILLQVCQMTPVGSTKGFEFIG